VAKKARYRVSFLCFRRASIDLFSKLSSCWKS